MREIEKLSSKFFCSILYLAKEGEVKRFIPFFFFFFFSFVLLPAVIPKLPHFNGFY